MKPANFVRTFLLFSLVLVQMVATSHTSLATITAGSVAGPGGTGDPNIFANVSEAALVYTAVDYLDITLTVDQAGYYDLSQAPGLGGVLNSTGTAWSGFQIAILSSDTGVEFTPLQFAPPTEPLAYDYAHVFPTPAWSTTTILFSGAVLNNVTSLAPVMAFQAAGPGTIVFRETPIAVPEPSTLVLACLGGVAVAWQRGRRSTRRCVK